MDPVLDPVIAGESPLAEDHRAVTGGEGEARALPADAVRPEADPVRAGHDEFGVDPRTAEPGGRDLPAQSGAERAAQRRSPRAGDRLGEGHLGCEVHDHILASITAHHQRASITEAVSWFGMRSASVPVPGRPVRGSSTGRPMMAALDLLGRRWTLRVIWELQQAPAGFRELRRRTDEMSSSVLAERLRQLADAGIVATDESGTYQLTELGLGLGPALDPLNAWAHRWAALTTAPTKARGSARR